MRFWFESENYLVDHLYHFFHQLVFFIIQYFHFLTKFSENFSTLPAATSPSKTPFLKNFHNVFTLNDIFLWANPTFQPSHVTHNFTLIYPIIAAPFFTKENSVTIYHPDCNICFLNQSLSKFSAAVYFSIFFLPSLILSQLIHTHE